MLSSAAWHGMYYVLPTQQALIPLFYIQPLTHTLMMISSCCLVVAEAEPAVALMVQGEESSWRMASAHERAAALPFNPALAYGAQAHAAALPACFMYYVYSLSTLFPSSTSPLMQAFSRTVEEEASKQRNATPHHHNCNFSQLAQHRFFKSLES
jgi:hypothetical protein